MRSPLNMRVIADIHAGNPKPACDRPLERCRLPPCDGGSIDEHTGRQAMQVTERIVGPRGLRRVMAHEGERTSQNASSLRSILQPAWTIHHRLQRRQMVATCCHRHSQRRTGGSAVAAAWVSA